MHPLVALFLSFLRVACLPVSVIPSSDRMPEKTGGEALTNDSRTHDSFASAGNILTVRIPKNSCEGFRIGSSPSEINLSKID
jgi:hypothetical protein